MDPTTEQRTNFGRRLRALRAEAGVSARSLAEQLADATGESCTGARVTGWERGEFAPRTAAVVQALEKILGADGELLALLGYAPPDASVSDRLDAVERRLSSMEELLQQAVERRRRR